MGLIWLPHLLWDRPPLHHKHTQDTFLFCRTAEQTEALKHPVCSEITDLSYPWDFTREWSKIMYVSLFLLYQESDSEWLIRWTWSLTLNVFPRIMKEWCNKQMHEGLHGNNLQNLDLLLTFPQRSHASPSASVKGEKE